MRLQSHVLLVTALSDVGLSTKEEPESFHLQKAKSLVIWENIQTLMRSNRRHEAATTLIEAAAHLCIAADKILLPLDKTRRS